MPVYRVHVCLDCTFDDIEADSPEDAFILASDDAMMCGEWEYEVEEVTDAD